jgi:hypothetical protein
MSCKMVLVPNKDKEFENNFFLICRYLSLVKKSENYFYSKLKITSCYNIKILCKLWEKYMFYFVELCMKRDNFGCIKKEICPIKNMQKHIILESSRQCANGLLH